MGSVHPFFARFDQHKHTGHSRHTPLRVTCVENGHIYAPRVEMFLTRSVFILHILFIFKYIYFAWNRTTHPTGRNSQATVQTADRWNNKYIITGKKSTHFKDLLNDVRRDKCGYGVVRIKNSAREKLLRISLAHCGGLYTVTYRRDVVTSP